jgi:hypothetical protein
VSIAEECEGGDTVCEWKYWLATTKSKPYKATHTIRLPGDTISKKTLIGLVDAQWYELIGRNRGGGVDKAPSVHRYKLLPKTFPIRVKSIIPNTELKWKMISKNGELGVLAEESHDALMEHNLENYA